MSKKLLESEKSNKDLLASLDIAMIKTNELESRIPVLERDVKLFSGAFKRLKETKAVKVNSPANNNKNKMLR